MTHYDFTIHDLGECGAFIQGNNAAARAQLQCRDAIALAWPLVHDAATLLCALGFTLEYAGTLPRH